jgi:hypothetical protein
MKGIALDRRWGFVAKFTLKTESPGFVSAERAYSRVFREINVVEIGSKIKLRISNPGDSCSGLICQNSFAQDKSFPIDPPLPPRSPVFSGVGTASEAHD